MRKDYIRTDLALERTCVDPTIDGITLKEEQEGDITVTSLAVTSAEGAEALGRPMGNYITLKTRPFSAQSEQELSNLASLLAKTLQKMCAKMNCDRILIAGLGNRALTVDAIGPLAASRIVATAHLAELEPSIFASLQSKALAVVAPGVLAETGLESASLIAGAIESFHPDLLIAIDALAARGASRLACTVQISDTGLYPGAGVGNHRTAIDKETLGVPVIVIGVPSIVDAATLLFDTLTEAGLTEELSSHVAAHLEEARSFFIAPRECDVITENAARIIAEGINRAFGVGHQL